MKPTESWRVGFVDPWTHAQDSPYADALKHLVYQRQEEAWGATLPHVVKRLPNRKIPYGQDSPHQTGEHTPYDILTRAPLWCTTSHTKDIPPHTPKRGVHRHIVAPSLFCSRGSGWEVNDGVLYEFGRYDLLVVPPWSVHQHGGDENQGCQILVPQPTRVAFVLGSLGDRELHQLAEDPTFLEGTEPIRDTDGKIVGLKIRKGVLGIEEDIDVMIGGDPDAARVFDERREITDWHETAVTTYDRYLQLRTEEVRYCAEVPHVIQEAEEPWELTRQGKIKWLVHPDTHCAAKMCWMYLQEIGPGSRSGMHWHAAEELVFVLEGRGYDIHDGEQWPWEAGDLICVPRMTTHQHFSTGKERVMLLCSLPAIYTQLGFGGIVQLEDTPEFESGGGERR